MAMNPNFGLQVLGRSNNSFLPPNHNYNPNICPSFPVLQQNSAAPFPPHHQNSAPPFPPHHQQHVFQSNSHFPGHMPSPFLPDLQIVKSVPPPSLMTSAPPALSSLRIPETPTPAWNPAPIIDNRHFIDQSSQFQTRPPSASNYLPPMFPSANYNNMNLIYPGSSGSSNGFSNQQNSMKDTSGPQTSNVFQGKHVAAFTNLSSDSSAQPRPNSFDYAPNGIRYDQNNGKAAFSNVRNSANHNINDKNPHSFSESMQSNSNQGFWGPGFGGFPNSAQNANEQARQKSPYTMESNYRIPHDASANNFKHKNGNRRHNPFGSTTSSPRNRKYNHTESVPHSMNLPHGDQNIKMNNGQGKKNMKTERNCEVLKPFSCDTCDRSFSSEVEMRHHLSEHIKCNSGDCQFEAHPKIVALHKKMQHDTGYADAISKLKSADDIEKWRAERRRRFPTVKNIQKRKAEDAEKEARGEVIENKDFGKFKGQNKQQNGCRNNNQGNAKKRRRCASKNKNAPRNIEYPHSVSKVTLNVSESESDSDDDSHIKLPKFLGMTVHTPEKGNLEFLSHEFSRNCKEVKVEVPIFNSVIDGNSDDESPIELPIRKSTSSLNQSIERDHIPEKTTSTIDIGSDDESPIELPVRKDALSTNQNIEREVKTANKNLESKICRQWTGNRENNLPPRKSSLLEKLLADDIRHERNAIMQCIRHVVKKNFFGIV